MPEELEKSEEEMKETEESLEEAEIETQKSGALFGPEGIVMMLAAGLLDLIGLIILCFGLDDFGILDIIGLFIIGGWMLSQSSQIIGTKGAKKVGGKIFKRLGLSFLGEIIPYFGNVAPCWLLAVYFTLKSK